MSNKRPLDQSNLSSQNNQPLTDSSPSSSSKTKKVKFGVLPTSSTQTKDKAPPPPPSSSSTFQPTDESTDLQFDELNQVGKIRKGRVKVDGYDSDSSTENNEVRTNAKNNKANGQEDDDMFGEHEQGPEKLKDLTCNSKFEKIDVGLSIKKGAESKDYLDLGDIEGQEFGRGDDEDVEEDEDGDGDHDSDRPDHKRQGDGDMDSTNGYSDEEEDFVPGDEFANADDAPRARRKSKKGMGYLLSKFNMAEELKEGRMAADGSYVPSAKDPEAVHDNWLEGVNTKKTIKQAREAKRKREEQLKNQLEKEESITSLRTRKECYIALLELLPAGDGRSVSQILCQLGNDKRALQHTEKKKKRLFKKSAIDDLVPDSMITDSTIKPTTQNTSNHENESGSTPHPKSEEEVQLHKTIGDITDLASTLMGTHGDLDIYDMTHGSITGILKSEGLVPRDWIPPCNRDPILNHLNNKSSPKHSSQQTINPNNPTRKSLISRPTNSSLQSSQSQSQSQPSIYYRFLLDPVNPSPSVDQSTVYGPFDRIMMETWAQQGFFGHQFDRIEVKIDNDQSNNDASSSWGPWNQIVGQ